MICPSKPLKYQMSKTASIDKALAPSDRGAIKIDQVVFTPFTAGPFMVPVTRWVE